MSAVRRRRSLCAPVILAVLAMSSLSGCFVFPGTAGERCNSLGQCGPGLACDPSSRLCADAVGLKARYCEGKQCGLSGGFECGPCPGRTDVCESDRCVNVCAFLACGIVSGWSCGECAGATEVCEANQCRDACAGKQCGLSEGFECGTCPGRTDVCESNQCVNVCAGSCGVVSGLSCGECTGTTDVCEANQCRDACAGKQCGSASGKDCGACIGATEVCEANQCVNVCDGKQCGMASGKDCGTCAGATELCQANRCVNVCAGLTCGEVSGLSCGTCTGATELCQSNRCVNVCAGLTCGEVSGVSCGTCTGATELCQSNRCVGYVLISAGTFTMGSPAGEPGRASHEVQLSVTLTRDYWLKETEVTQGEWLALMGNNPSFFASCGPNCPVEGVTWFDAVAYVNALSRSEGLPECYGLAGTFAGLSCRGYRLPTEAEWEYAARAGTLASSYNGTVTAGDTCNSDPALSQIAWYCGNSRNTPHPVRGKQANAWGLYDMLGNVWEWTNDWYGAYSTGAVTDPVGPSTGSNRVNRGGSWLNVAANCRAASRDFSDPSFRFAVLGFRPARSAGP